MDLIKQEITKRFIDSVNNLKKIKGLTQIDIARDLKTTPQNISNIMNGSRPVPQKLLIKFCELYSIDISIFNPLIETQEEPNQTKTDNMNNPINYETLLTAFNNMAKRLNEVEEELSEYKVKAKSRNAS